jgi:Flavin containing amine oxidoreductase.
LQALPASSALLRRQPSVQQTVAQCLARVPAALRQGLFDPICIGALNTPPARASAVVFHEVLRRALSGPAGDSDFIIPGVDLSALLPEPALARIQRLGGTVHLSCPVISIEQHEHGSFLIRHRHGEMMFDRVLLAVGPQHLPRLIRHLPDSKALAETLDTLEFQDIATVHLEFSYGLDAEADAIRDARQLPGTMAFHPAHEPGLATREPCLERARSKHAQRLAC